MLRRTERWEKPTIELPPGWKTAIERLALEIHGGKKGMMRYTWAVAADLLLGLDREDVKARARELQRLDIDDFRGLVLRRCDDPALATKLVLPDSGGPAKGKAARKTGESGRAAR